ncbi:hypothetical protein ZHAS_00000612 [Anopheles sinensis]|uniref:Uncharacterized protein n=1 Tax=Anopheles sinensis TaxID=74873 RepID=A0A084VAD2_ANOSI|nr:hypothetical protein ZHAS_00000612 [Anopheles sinensis]
MRDCTHSRKELCFNGRTVTPVSHLHAEEGELGKEFEPSRECTGSKDRAVSPKEGRIVSTLHNRCAQVHCEGTSQPDLGGTSQAVICVRGCHREWTDRL